jgi:hypothetical protein
MYRKYEISYALIHIQEAIAVTFFYLVTFWNVLDECLIISDGHPESYAAFPCLLLTVATFSFFRNNSKSKRKG